MTSAPRVGELLARRTVLVVGEQRSSSPSRERNAPDLRGRCFVAPGADARQFEGHPAMDGDPERAQDSLDDG